MSGIPSATGRRRVCPTGVTVTEIQVLPFHGSEIHTTQVNGEPVVILKPTIEAMGLDYSAQHAKLKSAEWATVGIIATVGADGRTRQMTTTDLDTWSMLLANINARKVKPELKPLIVAYQKESAKALRKFWTEGGVVNPAASTSQLQRLEEEVVLRLAERREYSTIRRQIKVAGGDSVDFADVQDLFYMTFFDTRARSIVKRQPQTLGQPYKVGPRKGQLRPSNVAKDHMTPAQLQVLNSAVGAVNNILALRFPRGNADLTAIKTTIKEVGRYNELALAA